MLDGHCAHCGDRAAHPDQAKRAKTGQTGKAHPNTAPRGTAPGSMLTEEKVIPFESIRPKEDTENKSVKKPEIELTLVMRDEQKEKEEAIARNTPWKVKGLTPAQRVSAFVKHYIGKFTAFVDGLVNPEDE